MSKLRIDYVNFYEKNLEPIAKAFGNNKLPVVNVKATNMAKRENGVSIKEALFEFKSGQKLVVKIKADGGVFQVKLNGKVLPVKEVFDIDAAFKEIVKLVKQNEAAYLAQKEKQEAQAVKKLARTAVTRASSSAQAKLEAAQAKLAETNGMISTTQTEARPVYDNLKNKETELGQLNGRITELDARNTELDGLIKEAEVVESNIFTPSYIGIKADVATKPLSELEGSEKQVKWANDLRTDVLTKISKQFGNVTPKDKKQQSMLDIVNDLISELKEQKSAKWWIESKYGISDFDKETKARAKKAGLI